MPGKRSFLAVLIICMIFNLFAGCQRNSGSVNSPSGVADAGKESAPFYERSTTQYPFPEDANQYMTVCAAEGFFYYVMGASDQEYQFYYQKYEEKNAGAYCTVNDGYVRDFSCVKKEDGQYLSILVIGENARILEFGENGELHREITADERFCRMETQMQILPLPDGRYVIAAGDIITFIDENGQSRTEISTEGQVQKLLMAGHEVYATLYRNSGKQSGIRLVKVDEKRNTVETAGEFSDEAMGVFAFEEGFAVIYRDKAVYLKDGREKDLIDLERQELMASQIHFLFGTASEIRLVCMDPYDKSYTAYLYRLSLRDQADDARNGKETAKDQKDTVKERALYTDDGRRIIYVAIPKDCYYQVEFHAKKYNLSSDGVMIKVERFEGSLEDYLGKGNRPDVIMFHDQTEMPDYIRKKLLVDLISLYQGQEKYSEDDMIPKAREALGLSGDSGMYAMAGRFRLLIRPSDGSEYDADGGCDMVRYIKWYDRFLTENEIEGIGQTEELLYEAVRDFYDEESAKADFASPAFQEILSAYKELKLHHKGQLSPGEADFLKKDLARGPMWRASYLCSAIMAPGVKMTGLPGSDGGDHVSIRFYYPMSILTTSDCREEAFDFIMYYNTLGELLQVGWPESDYGKGSSTEAIFSVYQHLLDEQIFEWDDVFMSFAERDENGIPVNVIPYYLEEEQKQQLRFLIDSAIPETESQRVIYEMLMEEADAYLNGDKDLDNVCGILQNRAELYLKEQK